jgi:hypothetical protein
MKPPDIERREYGANEEPEGWRTLLSVQTNGRDLAVQIEERLVPLLDGELTEKIISIVKDALYRMRPDLRRQ